MAVVSEGIGGWENEPVPRRRLRSVRYDLDSACEVARVVDNAGGSLQSDLLARALGYSGTNNGTYLTRLANARLFGVVGGRGSRIELTERGRLILSGEEPAASEARRDAFEAVPLFREVLLSYPSGALPERPLLAERLRRDFDETESRAFSTAGKLIDSAHQAGLVPDFSDANGQLGRDRRQFTAVDNLLPRPLFGKLVKFVSKHPPGRATSARTGRDEMDADGLWLDEEPGIEKRPGRSWGRIAVVAASVACLAAVAVPVTLAATSSKAPSHLAKPKQTNNGPAVFGNGPAEHQVLSALSATTDSGSFDFDYRLSTTPSTSEAPATTTTTECHAVTVPENGAAIPTAIAGSIGSNDKRSTTSVTAAVHSPVSSKLSSSGSESSSGTRTVTECTGQAVANSGTPTSGGGVIDVNPKSMLIDFNVGASSSAPFVLGSDPTSSGSSSSGLKGTLRVDTTTLYEDLGTVETTLNPPSSMANASGQSISGFAGLTESTIGTREGAVAMMGMASPTGYLDLYQQDITGANQTGTSTVNGVPVTVYEVAIDPSQLLNAPGVSSEESATITAALGVLKNEGYTGTTVDVSVDASGFIREAKSVAQFSDGGTVVLDATLSNFGCAGTVLMPGQSGPTSPPAGCASPDTGVAAAPNASSNEPATTVAPTSTTTIASTTTTTGASSTTTSTSSNSG